MMNWNGGWGWMWLMFAMMLGVWALIALLVLPRLRTGPEQNRSPIDRLDARLAAGELTVEEYRSLRRELESHTPE